MKYPMTLKEYYNYNENDINSQILEWNYDNFSGRFFANNLSTIKDDGYHLFNANDFIAAVEFGIDLARKGYTGIEVTTI